MPRGPVYNSIGFRYSAHRQPDSRIVAELFELIDVPSGSTLADVGAGSGNYSRALADRGFRLIAVEPSSVMQKQADRHPSVVWCTAVAENIPLRDLSVGGVVCILALHHFKSAADSLREMIRISSGPIVVLTFDPRAEQRFWLREYFPHVWADAYRAFSPLQDILVLLRAGGAAAVESFPFRLPPNLQDRFLAAGWQQPEMYFDPDIRACMSGFALADQTLVSAGLQRLRTELDNGSWEVKHGWVRRLQAFDAGYRFILARPRAT